MMDGIDLAWVDRTDAIIKAEDRIRVDLEHMCQQVMEHLSLCDICDHSQSSLTKLATQFNIGALVQYQAGEITSAEALCHRAIDIFAKISREDSCTNLCHAFMLPPYINLARLEGHRGNVERCMSMLDEVYNFGKKRQGLSIDGHCLMPCDMEEIEKVGKYYSQLPILSRWFDGSRALLTKEAYQRLFEFTEENLMNQNTEDRLFRQSALEMKVRALVGLSRFREAIHVTEELHNSTTAQVAERIQVSLLASQILRLAGQADDATKIRRAVETSVEEIESQGMKLPIARRIAYRAALEMHLSGDREMALRHADRAFKLARRWSDQPGSVRAAILLLRITQGKKSSRRAEEERYWYQMLENLTETCTFPLEAAYAYWELGANAYTAAKEGQYEREPKGARYLQESIRLFQSISLRDSQLCSRAVSVLISRVGRTAWGKRVGSQWTPSPLIREMFDRLMEVAV